MGVCEKERKKEKRRELSLTFVSLLMSYQEFGKGCWVVVIVELRQLGSTSYKVIGHMCMCVCLCVCLVFKMSDKVQVPKGPARHVLNTQDCYYPKPHSETLRIFLFHITLLLA